MMYKSAISGNKCSASIFMDSLKNKMMNNVILDLDRDTAAVQYY